jgi:hypothetical protein
MSKHNRERRQQRRKPSGHREAVRAAARELLAKGAVLPGRVYALAVYHDGACDLLADRGPCNCCPQIGTPQLVPVPEDN